MLLLDVAEHELERLDGANACLRGVFATHYAAVAPVDPRVTYYAIEGEVFFIHPLPEVGFEWKEAHVLCVVRRYQRGRLVGFAYTVIAQMSAHGPNGRILARLEFAEATKAYGTQQHVIVEL